MSDLRDNLEHAKQAYGRLKYDGDLAADVFARLDAERAASMKIDRPATRAMNWRPLLAIAAAVAVIATTVVTLMHTGRDQTNKEIAIDVLVPTDQLPPPTTPKLVEPPADVVATAEPSDFTVVPSYQSFAISVPTSLSLASIDEYDRQTQEQSKTETTTDANQTTIQ